MSPEDFGRRIRRSGSTVRRWESNRQVPDEADIARIADLAQLTPLQVAFLSAACTRMWAIPAPPKRKFIEHMDQVLCSTPFPAMLLDGLFVVRAWNSYVDALSPGISRTLQRNIHPLAVMMRARPAALLEGEQYEQSLRNGLRIFWMGTAVHSHRPEYAAILAELDREPHFREMWMELALGRECAPVEPIGFPCSLGGSGARLRVYSRTITFPPPYYLNEYQPDDDLSRERLRLLAEKGPPEAFFKPELHWVTAPAGACSWPAAPKPAGRQSRT